MSDNLQDERKIILELLKDGKVTTDEAIALLDALKEEKPKRFSGFKGGNRLFKMLKIQIDSKDGDKVRLKVPLEFAKIFKKGKFGNVNLSQFDIDMDEIIKQVNEGAYGELVNIVSDDGDIIKIFFD